VGPAAVQLEAARDLGREVLGVEPDERPAAATELADDPVGGVVATGS